MADHTLKETLKHMIRALREEAQDSAAGAEAGAAFGGSAPPPDGGVPADAPPVYSHELPEGQGEEDTTGAQPALGNGMAQKAAQAAQERNRRLRELDEQINQ